MKPDQSKLIRQSRWTIYVCPDCGGHPGHNDGCPRKPRKGQFTSFHMYEVVPVEVVRADLVGIGGEGSDDA